MGSNSDITKNQKSFDASKFTKEESGNENNRL